ncbi:hypothetical protein LSAT2_027706 [Lamellibrachia satsuma]|nr:hypothetical protein LSAT2_027706 [Lamellibrachia satsuma]
MNLARTLHPRLKYDHVDMDVEDVLQVITDPFKKYADLAITQSTLCVDNSTTNHLLQSRPEKSWITLYDCHLDIHLVNHLSDGLAENTSIWSLNLYDCHLDSHLVNHLSDGLAENTSIWSLNVSLCPKLWQMYTVKAWMEMCQSSR